LTLDRRKLGPLFLVAALLAIWLVLGRSVPSDQVIHVVLGDAAARVTELRLRYLPSESGGDAEIAREASFRYAAGQAPRIVTHEPRLAGGDYMVEIEVSEGNDRALVRRKVKLDGSPVSLDVKESLP
jgi:hypothetical protein